MNENPRNGRRWILVPVLVLGLGALVALAADVANRRLAKPDAPDAGLARASLRWLRLRGVR